MFFFHNSSTFAKVLEVINTLGLGRLVSELPSPDGTRTGLFTPDNASKDTLLEFSFVHQELQAVSQERGRKAIYNITGNFKTAASLA